MAAPVIAGSTTAYAGYTLGGIVESVLNGRGQTADAANYDFSPASAGTIARVRTLVRDGLAFLYSQRERWYPLRVHQVTAQAQTNGKYSRVAVPADAAVVDGAAVAGCPLDIISTEVYFRSLVPTSEGGGSSLVQTSGSPTHAVFQIGSVGERVLTVLPEQDAVFTLDIYYRASGADLDADEDVIVLPLVMQPLLVLYCAYFLTFQDGDMRGAVAAWAHFQDRLDEVSFMPPANGSAPLITSVLPSE